MFDFGVLSIIAVYLKAVAGVRSWLLWGFFIDAWRWFVGAMNWVVWGRGFFSCIVLIRVRHLFLV
ncbi:MAG TPA: hypothetical protein PK129_11440, partial [Cellvibrionaceae bacterium]|nr:hypothetical protein [Cellvibrionaceae bacterium]